MAVSGCKGVPAMDRESLRQTLLERLRQEKDEVPATLPDDLSLREGLGLDSIDFVSLVISLQEHFAIELKTEELEKLVNVGDLINLVQSKLAAIRPAA
jgi:acyl carrier protein